MPTALAIAAKIASYSLPAVIAAKAAVAQSEARPLVDGVVLEQRLFHALFAGDDQKEGMAAFIAKRAPSFRQGPGSRARLTPSARVSAWKVPTSTPSAVTATSSSSRMPPNGEPYNPGSTEQTWPTRSFIVLPGMRNGSGS